MNLLRHLDNYNFNPNVKEVVSTVYIGNKSKCLECKKCVYYAPKRDFGYKIAYPTCLKHDQLPMSQAKKKCGGKEFVANYSKAHYTPADRGIAMEIIKHLKRVESDYGIDLTTEISWLMDKVKLNK